MQQVTTPHPIDYLLIGHITQDITTEGPRLGGSVTYSALTAQAIGLRVGIVTSFAEELVDMLMGWRPGSMYFGA